MNDTPLQPIPNEPALFIKKQKILVVADLHIGIEHELREQGLHIPSQTATLTHRLLSLIKRFHPNDIVLLGDIKHNIPSSTREERTDVTRFLTTIQSHATIHIIPGNHDGNLHQLVPTSVILHSSDGFILGEIGFIHGHRWPKTDLMHCQHLILGHTHPTIQLTDRLGYRTFEPCWIRGIFLPEKIIKRYQNQPYPQAIIMPAFHPLCGGIAANTEPLVGPLATALDIPNAQVYLLDGSYLGKIKNIH